jgi:hypothetical protein
MRVTALIANNDANSEPKDLCILDWMYHTLCIAIHFFLQTDTTKFSFNTCKTPTRLHIGNTRK